jgi:hypothetical protein
MKTNFEYFLVALARVVTAVLPLLRLAIENAFFKNDVVVEQ